MSRSFRGRGILPFRRQDTGSSEKGLSVDVFDGCSRNLFIDSRPTILRRLDDRDGKRPELVINSYREVVSPEIVQQIMDSSDLECDREHPP